MKKFITSFLLLTFFMTTSANAETVWADDSINDDIVKIYNTNAINEEFLPNLPDSLKNEKKSQQNSTSENKQEAPLIKESVEIIKPSQNIQSNYKSNKTVILKQGTKFKLRTESAIDDATPIGSKIYLTSLYPETNKYATIPAGTTFVGVIEDAHLPQISSNGGLLVLKINKLVYNGRTYPINAQVIKVGEKRIFQNNIKGEHKYWKNVSNTAKPSINFYKKSWRTTKKFAQDGLEIILTPITFTAGAVVIIAGTVSSPVVAFFKKGGRLFINKGTVFQIKLTEDATISI